MWKLSTYVLLTKLKACKEIIVQPARAARYLLLKIAQQRALAIHSVITINRSNVARARMILQQYIKLHSTERYDSLVQLVGLKFHYVNKVITFNAIIAACHPEIRQSCEEGIYVII